MLREKAGRTVSRFTPRILVAGTHSGVGKTTVATGIMAALRVRGMRVQGFKVGPDFIDPTFHHAATGRPGRNLDGWMLSRSANLEIVARATRDADAIVIEGVMGLFDGKDGAGLAGTTAEMAMWLDASVALVVDAAAMAGSIAAVVHGFDTLVPGVRVEAVIANRVAGAGHYAFLCDALRAHGRSEAVGFLPADAELRVPERHLGLHLAEEALSPERLARLAAAVEQHVDLDRLLALALRPHPECAAPAAPSAARARIGVARDLAFCFYYEDNLDALRQAGAELVEFSPVRDAALPADLDALYLGGGYPELHAAALSANAAMRAAVAEFAARGGRVYAECGGFLYLTEGIVDTQGEAWPMAGVFPTRARVGTSLARIGYVEVEAEGRKARGHEFRYAVADAMPERVERAYRGDAEGYRVGSVVASFAHLHFLSCPGFAERFLGVAR